MAAIDITRARLGEHVRSHGCELPQILIEELLDQRSAFSHNVRPESAWIQGSLAGLLDGEAFEETQVAEGEETLLGSDELSREAISFAAAPVVIALTDEQAGQFLRFQSRGAQPQ